MSKQRYSAYRVLTYLLYGHYPTFFNRPGTAQVQVLSLSKFARLVGIESKRLNTHLKWLEQQGYIRQLTYSDNKRQVHVYLEVPRV